MVITTACRTTPVPISDWHMLYFPFILYYMFVCYFYDLLYSMFRSNNDVSVRQLEPTQQWFVHWLLFVLASNARQVKSYMHLHFVRLWHTYHKLQIF